MATGRGDDSEKHPYPEAQGPARTRLGWGPAARRARPGCHPGQSALPRRQSPPAEV